MRKGWLWKLIGVTSGVLLIDQGLKAFFWWGFNWHSQCISLVLVVNRGVAFSLLEELGGNLKFYQLILIGVVALLLWREGALQRHPILFGLIFGGGLSNILDRFTRGGVVDYLYWHCGFQFPVFNLADVLIDLGVGFLLLHLWLSHRKVQQRG
ncbi:MAG: signal peptidase II [Campylobacterales bacterium]